jgi:hypothetical protein
MSTGAAPAQANACTYVLGLAAKVMSYSLVKLRVLIPMMEVDMKPPL